MRISIITPSYQQASYLQECLDSVAAQDHDDVEHIVVDGGSTDGSEAMIRAHADKLAWWCSCPDGGQSAALNKGLAKATGEVFGWINSDDLLLPGALRHVAEIFTAHPEIHVVTGVRLRRRTDGSDEVRPSEDPIDTRAWFIAPRINQQATFIRLSALRAMGGIDERLHYVMDLELWWRNLFVHGPASVHVTQRPLAVFRMHKESKSTKAQPAFIDETAAILHGACMDVGASQFASVLAMGHAPFAEVRRLPVVAAHREVVEVMTLQFLLKWDRGLFTRTQYRMMRQVHQIANAVAPRLDAEHARFWHEMAVALLSAPGWWAYRIRRKWEHLRG
jgi:hypothetical protein